MLHLLIMAGASVVLFLLNRFVEVTSPYEFGSHASYGQIGGLLACVVGSAAGAMILYERYGALMKSHLRLSGAAWAAPLLIGQWSVDTYSTASGLVAVRHGFGGPLTLAYIVAAAVALILLDALLRIPPRAVVGTGPDEANSPHDVLKQ